MASMGEELRRDPAIERWAAMREHTHFYYRFNRRKLFPLFMLLGGVPAAIVGLSLWGFVRGGRGIVGGGAWCGNRVGGGTVCCRT